ncbi:Fc.00g027770.m01.CDS01 [Cosmosporella sp. VM-42]
MDFNHKKDVTGSSATILSQLIDDQVKYSILRLVEQETRFPDSVKCKNCEKMGHLSWSCPEPKNWTKVQCRNCKEWGHTRFKCNKPPHETHDNIANAELEADDDELGLLTSRRTLVFFSDRWHLAITVFRDGKKISYSLVPLPEDVGTRKGPHNPLLDPMLN